MAVAAKSKAPASDQIMSAGEMKPLLALSKREPVQAAIGLTADGEGVILLNKKMKAKKVLANLKAEAGKAKIQLQPSTLRFGKAEVDTDYDAGMVRFFINKEAPGNMRMKLLEVVKRIPYQKVEINVDPSLEEESEDDEVEGQETAAATAAAAAPAAPPPPPAPPGADLTMLSNTLNQLTLAIPKVANGDAALHAAWVQLAQTGSTALKAKDAAALSAAIEALRSAMGVAMEAAKQKAAAAGPAAAGKGATGAVAYAKSRLAWLAARKKVESDIETLRVKIIEEFKDDAIAPQLDTSYRSKVKPVLEALDESLADTLDAATNATDPAARAKLVAEAKAIMKTYEAYLSGTELLKDLDENPFHPLQIRAVVGSTISALSKAIA